MSGVNKFICVGNICKDLDVSYSQSGKCVCKFTIITSDKYNGEEKKEFTNFIAFDKAGELIAKYCTKGSQLYVEAKKQKREYNGKYYTDFIVREFQFLGGKSNNNQQQGQGRQQQNGGYSQGGNQGQGGNGGFGGGYNGPDDTLPF